MTGDRPSRVQDDENGNFVKKRVPLPRVGAASGRCRSVFLPIYGRLPCRHADEPSAPPPDYVAQQMRPLSPS